MVRGFCELAAVILFRELTRCWLTTKRLWRRRTTHHTLQPAKALRASCMVFASGRRQAACFMNYSIAIIFARLTQEKKNWLELDQYE